MSEIQRLNVESLAVSGNITYPADNTRGYFALYQTGGTSTIEINNGGGLIPVSTGGVYEPSVCPTGEIDIVSAGVYVVVMG